jgi:tetratricopeptide (TPR) repeat protein
MDIDTGLMPASQTEIARDWDSLCLNQARYFRPPAAEAEAGVTLELARGQNEQKHYEAADRLYGEFLEQRPDHPQALVERALNNILRGAYAEASNDLERYAIARKDPAALPVERTVLCAAAGEGEQYRRTCRALLAPAVDRFRGTSYEALKFASFAPYALDAAGYGEAIRLLEQALERGAGGEGTQQVLVGLLYRAGRYRDAVERLEGGGGPAAKGFKAPALLFGAMAYAHLGNAEAARGQMALADAWITANGAGVWDWPNRLEIDLLGREAQTTLKAQGVAFDPLPELR